MKKNEIIEKLKQDNRREGSNSMGVSESWYDPYFLLKFFLRDKEIDPNSLNEKELNLLLDLAEYTGDVFY